MRVDPAFHALLADPRVHLRRPAPPLTVPQLREAANAFMARAAGPAMASVTDRSVTGPDGQPIALRVYEPVQGAYAAARIVFCHGGGFVFGSLDTHDAMARSLAQHSGAAVVAVDYRLAPEHPHPAAVEDCLAVVRSLRAEDPEEAAVPLALAGDSAGGHIALESALRLAAADETVAHVAVLYPVISAACNSDSMRVFGEGHMLTREAMRWFWECYLGEGAESAARTTDLLQVALGALPPVTLVTAGCDPLRDEGERFARRLAQSGARVASRRYPGMIHGFAGLPQLTGQAGEALLFLGGALAAALGRTPVPQVLS